MAWRCHCNSTSVNGTAATASTTSDDGQQANQSGIDTASKGGDSKVDAANVKEEGSDSEKAEDTDKGTTAQSEEEASDATTTKDAEATDVEAPDSAKTTTPAKLTNGTSVTNGTTTQTTTTQAVWRRPTTTTTIYTPAPADVTQTWMSKENTCLATCKEAVDRVFGRGPLPSTDSATFAVKMMNSCRTMMDFLRCVRESPDLCPADGEIAQSVEFYTAMCMCPCRDSFVRGLRKSHENPEANMCVNFEDFAGCAACASQREECEYALVDTKTEVAGRLLEAAAACPTASCTGYLWQWQPTGSSSVISAGAGAADDAGGALKTFGEMSCTALYLLLAFWVFVN